MIELNASGGLVHIVATGQTGKAVMEVKPDEARKMAESLILMAFLAENQTR